MRLSLGSLSLVAGAFAALLAGAVATSDAARADRRVAFVVGNGAYTSVDPLPNPPVDARAMASLLRNAGFEVVEGTDLGRDAMTAKLRDFALRSQGSDIALFFYAGHGIAVNGKNYLIPIDADLKSEMDVKLGAAIDVDVTLDQTMSDAKVKLVLLDACRDNPFAAKIRSATRTRNVVVSSGLAEMKSGEGTLIAFATGPGQTALDGAEGGNSPFTRALLAHLATPGIEIQQAMTRVRAQVSEETKKQQLPWGHTNLTGSVFVNPAGAPALAPADTPLSADAAPAVGTQTRSAVSEAELEFWRTIRDSNKPEELNAYLLNFPNGQFRPIALSRLAALQAQPAKPRPAAEAADPALFTTEASLATEDKLGLTKAKRRDVQKRLTALGFDTKADGKFSDETRKVIARWQAARGYPESGYLNAPQHKALLKEDIAGAEEDRPAARTERKVVTRERRSGGGGGGGGGRHYNNGPPPIFNLMLGGPFGRR
ncbi:caspase domain-containing protein [Rhodoplanes sp. TEM]|uniref:Caspase domain-containing protein n=1 Tax=Rhodoplanes tepidamans TaxID=200616 RepID=A0ABT5JCN1_RHOTP|nr:MULTISPECIES: caspase domain-containing protein [Rhodoplanes]MDC7787268.1 caspase domain-containing protein [Rhodoplanes tepidamans]MDC7985296.1 caspase domain-containing protein [Rhodoplanes sp. TEM]MDQ0357803.1 putative caspase-like protein [Rhodoplanes tepidamans]